MAVEGQGRERHEGQLLDWGINLCIRLAMQEESSRSEGSSWQAMARLGLHLESPHSLFTGSTRDPPQVREKRSRKGLQETNTVAD